MKIAKWPFGMAPLKPATRAKYTTAVQAMETLRGFVCRRLTDIERTALGEVKGLFNRCVRQDQWDWSTVHAMLGYPPRDICKAIAQALTEYANVDKEGNIAKRELCVRRLTDLGFFALLDAFDGSAERSIGAGFVYVLSTREDKDVLKVGFTTRTVEQRAKEINGGTGVLYPLGARAVFEVVDAQAGERAVHDALQPYRIRADREFFALDFRDAERIIRHILMGQDLLLRQEGRVKWWNDARSYGAIEKNDGSSVFFHKDNDDVANLDLEVGDAVSFYERIVRQKRGAFRLRKI